MLNRPPCAPCFSAKAISALKPAVANVYNKEAYITSAVYRAKLTKRALLVTKAPQKIVLKDFKAGANLLPYRQGYSSSISGSVSFMAGTTLSADNIKFAAGPLSLI